MCSARRRERGARWSGGGGAVVLRRGGVWRRGGAAWMPGRVAADERAALGRRRFREEEGGEWKGN